MKIINNIPETVQDKDTVTMIIFIYQQLVATKQIKHNNNISK